MAQNISIFESLFNEYYSGLVIYASRYTRDTAIAEDVVCDVYTNLWANWKTLHSGNMKSYLFTAVRSRCLNYLNRLDVRNQYQEEILHTGEATGPLTWECYVESELGELIDSAVENLPSQCRKVFRMNRFENKGVNEIANELQLSPRTVEKHIEVALKKLRQELADYLPTGLLFWLLNI